MLRTPDAAASRPHTVWGGPQKLKKDSHSRCHNLWLRHIRRALRSCFVSRILSGIVTTGELLILHLDLANFTALSARYHFSRLSRLAIACNRLLLAKTPLYRTASTKEKQGKITGNKKSVDFRSNWYQEFVHKETKIAPVYGRIVPFDVQLPLRKLEGVGEAVAV